MKIWSFREKGTSESKVPNREPPSTAGGEMHAAAYLKRQPSRGSVGWWEPGSKDQQPGRRVWRAPGVTLLGEGKHPGEYLTWGEFLVAEQLERFAY